MLSKRRESVSPETRERIAISFDIVDRIHEILERQGKSQKDLAKLLNKNESEISKWMHGNHNFTIDTLAKIHVALGENIVHIKTCKNEEKYKQALEYRFNMAKPMYIQHIIKSKGRANKKSTYSNNNKMLIENEPNTPSIIHFDERSKTKNSMTQYS